MPEATPPRPISLSDEQMQTVLDTAEPLPRQDRSRFLESVAMRLRHEQQIGDGAVNRACRESFAEIFRPPALQPGPQQLPKERRAVR
jgi:hypothetical protein